jgi:hypothetical protein
MFLARSTDGSRITSTREEKGFCPSCNDELTAKQGEVYEWHWSHRPGRSCEYRSGSTYWHYGWMAHYHALGGWEMEVTENGVEFDGTNRSQKRSLLLADKIDFVSIKNFIARSHELELEPVIIFNAKVFQRFDFSDNRFKSKQRSDTTWIVFSSYGNPKSRRKASMWLDVDSEKLPSFALGSGIYRLSHSDLHSNEICVDPDPKKRSTTRKSDGPD